MEDRHRWCCENWETHEAQVEARKAGSIRDEDHGMMSSVPEIEDCGRNRLCNVNHQVLTKI
jgi:hypothetical protein